MKKLFVIPCLLVLFLASCQNNQKACYEITLTANGQSETMYIYADENGADAQATALENRYAAMGYSKDKLSVQVKKLDKSESDCQASSDEEETEKEIKRTVKPTASFEMKVVGINPDGYSDTYGGARGLGGFSVTCRYVAQGGHTSSPLMEIMYLSNGLSHQYNDVTFGEYVKDNSYVGGRIICFNPYYDKNVEYLTDEEKTRIGQTMDNYFTGTPDGPFKIKKSCTWTFRLGRDSTYTYVDEVVDTYSNYAQLKAALLSCDADNPIFQSLYYYDAKKDEFILKDRKTWNLK